MMEREKSRLSGWSASSPRARRTFAGLWTGCFLLLAAGSVQGQSSPREGDEARAAHPRGDAVEIEASSANEESGGAAARWEPVPYIPPSRGRAEETAGAGTRTMSRGDVTVRVLAPNDHVAVTTLAQPTLYWYVSQDTTARIDLTLVDDDAIDPLVEFTVPGPVKKGVHAFRLSDRDLSLAPEKTYRWHVSLVQDPNRRSNDKVAEGRIVRAPATPQLEQSLERAPERYAPYAISGIWYDAMHELLSAIERDPDNRRLQLQRNALLEQAGLSEVATYAVRAGR